MHLSSIPRLERSPGGGHGKRTPVFLLGESPWTEEPGRLFGAVHGLSLAAASGFLIAVASAVVEPGL